MSSRYNEGQRIIAAYADRTALLDLRAVKQTINHYIDEGFVTDFCQDQNGRFTFSCNPDHFAERVEATL